MLIENVRIFLQKLCFSAKLTAYALFNSLQANVPRLETLWKTKWEVQYKIKQRRRKSTVKLLFYKYILNHSIGIYYLSRRNTKLRNTLENVHLFVHNITKWLIKISLYNNKISPNFAFFHWIHVTAGFAWEIMRKFLHITNSSDDAKLVWRMHVGGDEHFIEFGPCYRTPCLRRWYPK